jgi:putative chitinase
LRLTHFMAQIGHECGLFTIRRESMTYTTVARILEIFGVGHHSAKVTRAEAPGLVRQPKKLAERVYGVGNPRMAKKLGNTE